MDRAEFETSRLALFDEYGFVGVSRWLESGSGRRTSVVFRDGPGRPVVLVHGGLSQAGEWAPVAGLLEGAVAIPDRPGWGLSDAARLHPATFRDDQSAWLLGVVDGLGFEDVTLVASSIGAYVGLVFAHDHPERVHELITVGAPAGLTRRPMPMFARLMGTPGVGQLLARMTITDPEVNRKRVFANLVAHPEAVPVAVLQHDIDAMSLPGASRQGYELMKAMSTLRGFRSEVLIGDELPTTPTKTLVLWGERDTFIPLDEGRRITAALPNAQFEMVPDAGHCIHVEMPKLVAARITAAL